MTRAYQTHDMDRDEGQTAAALTGSTASVRALALNPTHAARRSSITAIAAIATSWLGAALLSACGSLVPPTETPRPTLREDFRVADLPSAMAAASSPMAGSSAGSAATSTATSTSTAPSVGGTSAPASTTGSTGSVSATGAARAADAATAAPEWQGFFADARLDQVVGLALSQNRSLQASAAAVERVRAQYRIAEADRMPELSAGGSVTRQRTNNGQGATTTSGVNLGLASYEIDLFNRLGSLEGAALARFLAQQETQRSAQLSLVAEVANAWLTLAAERQRLALSQSLLDSQQRSLNLAERQYQLGATSGLVRARARTAFESARGDAARSASAVAQARLQLELLVGQPVPEDWLPGEQITGDVTALPAIPGGLPADVLLQRPDLRAAEQRLQAAAFDVGAARAARFPRLTLTASAGTRSADLDGLFKSGSGVWSLVPQIDLPLFDAGARRAQVAVSEATRREALATYESTVQSAFREVADALAVRDRLAERLDAQQAQVDAASESLRMAESSYRLGGSSQLELLDTQRTLATAQQGLVTLRLTEQSNRVALLRALGGRWNAAGTVPRASAIQP